MLPRHPGEMNILDSDNRQVVGDCFNLDLVTDPLSSIACLFSLESEILPDHQKSSQYPIGGDSSNGKPDVVLSISWDVDPEEPQEDSCCCDMLEHEQLISQSP